MQGYIIIRGKRLQEKIQK